MSIKDDSNLWTLALSRRYGLMSYATLNGSQATDNHIQEGGELLMTRLHGNQQKQHGIQNKY